MSSARLPRLFVAAGTRRGLWTLAALTLLSGAAMLPAIATMADHGASVIAFEKAGSVARSREILLEWGSAGKTAMWWQLALDTPFLVGYGLFLAGACAAVARRASEVGRPRLERAAVALAWFGPIGAGADLLQNVSLALVLSGHVNQPWPRISAIAAPTTTCLCTAAALFALVAALATRSSRRS
jgi:Zn-dependent protease